MPWSGDADDPLRNTRTTRTNRLERAFVAPYFVNYHLEHHLFYLRALLSALRAAPHPARGTPWRSHAKIAPGYAAVLRQVTSRDEVDRPNALGQGVRGELKANANPTKAGF